MKSMRESQYTAKVQLKLARIWKKGLWQKTRLLAPTYPSDEFLL